MAHLDIKPENFLITDDFRIALTNFLCAQPYGRRLHINQGTQNYQPPEIVNNDQNKVKLDYLGEKSDIWSLGINLFICLSFHHPYESLEDDYYYGFIENRDIDNFFKLHGEMNDIPISLKEAIFSCLHPDPQERIQIQDLLDI